MSRDTILIIEDERNLVNGLRDALEHHGYAVLAAEDGEEGLEVALSGRPDLILLDLMLPGIDGVDLCRLLRRRGVQVPIIMLTARSQEGDKVLGLDAGADDYVTKPFGVAELLARVRAQLRRRDEQAGAPPERVEIGGAVVDLRAFVVYRDDQRHELTEREIALLRLLLAHPHEVIPRDRLLDEVWGIGAYPTARTVDTFIYRLRQKIEADSQQPRHLLTVRGVGYKFVP